MVSTISARYGLPEARASDTTRRRSWIDSPGNCCVNHGGLPLRRREWRKINLGSWYSRQQHQTRRFVISHPLLFAPETTKASAVRPRRGFLLPLNLTHL